MVCRIYQTVIPLYFSPKSLTLKNPCYQYKKGYISLHSYAIYMCIYVQRKKAKEATKPFSRFEMIFLVLHG